MKMFIISIKDTAADAFGRPVYVATEGVAIRQFQDEVNRADDDNQIYRHPDDFHLYALGIFDDNTGKFDILEQPRLVARAKELMIKAGE